MTLQYQKEEKKIEHHVYVVHSKHYAPFLTFNIAWNPPSVLGSKKMHPIKGVIKRLSHISAKFYMA